MNSKIARGLSIGFAVLAVGGLATVAVGVSSVLQASVKPQAPHALVVDTNTPPTLAPTPTVTPKPLVVTPKPVKAAPKVAPKPAPKPAAPVAPKTYTAPVAPKAAAPSAPATYTYNGPIIWTGAKHAKGTPIPLIKDDNPNTGQEYGTMQPEYTETYCLSGAISGATAPVCS